MIIAKTDRAKRHATIVPRSGRNAEQRILKNAAYTNLKRETDLSISETA